MDLGSRSKAKANAFGDARVGHSTGMHLNLARVQLIFWRMAVCVDAWEFTSMALSFAIARRKGWEGKTLQK